jgi:hypothetical protein
MVTIDAADPPGAIADGFVADSVKVGGGGITTAATVTFAVPVAEA